MEGQKRSLVDLEVNEDDSLRNKRRKIDDIEVEDDTFSPGTSYEDEPSLSSSSSRKLQAESDALEAGDSEEKTTDDADVPKSEADQSANEATQLNNAESAENAAKTKKRKQEEERKKMQLLVSNFSEDQLNRYEMYRRAAFPKAAIKRIMQTVTGSALAPNVVIAMSGMAKVFVGEIVEEALDICELWGENSPIKPKHIREAIRRLNNKDGVNPNNQGSFLR